MRGPARGRLFGPALLVATLVAPGISVVACDDEAKPGDADGDDGGSSLSGGIFDPTDICDDLCTCEGCSDLEREDCLNDARDLEQTAEERGCHSEFDAYIGCLRDQVECVSGSIHAFSCEPQAKTLSSCMSPPADAGS